MRLPFVVAALLLAAASGASAMQMQVIGDQIIMSGGVSVGDDQRLRKLLDEAGGTVKTLILRNSHGGDADTGYKVGDMARARGLGTAVSGYCLSACSRMFLGGVQRQFTDQEPARKTQVGFHGNYDSNGIVKLENAWRLQEWIVAHSDGKADLALVKRWTSIKNRKGFAHFFDSQRLGRDDGVSIFLCTGDEAKIDECEKIPGKTGYDLGIFTSPALIKVNAAP